jgi:hypothetical protein
MIGGSSQGLGAARRVREARRRRKRALGAVIVLALLVAAGLVARQVLLERQGASEVPPEPASVPAEAPGAPPPTATSEPPLLPSAAEPAAPAEPLPALGESDAFVRERAARASPRSELTPWLAGEGLVARFVAAVDAVANGESPRAQLPELAPRGPFRVLERGGRSFVAPQAYARYDLVASVFASLDPASCARIHALLLPLFEEAYRELGGPEGRFDDVLARAFRELLRTPVREGQIELLPVVKSYDLADPELEALSPAQKHLLRMGPRNARRIQAKLSELAPALGLDVTAATASAR